jgi:molybdate transport system ATP-binding protein
MLSEHRRWARGPAPGGNPAPAALIAFEAVSLRIGGSRILEGVTWRVRRGEQWVVLGPNGAGKSTLLAAVAGRVAAVAGRTYRSDEMARRSAVGYISFDLQRRILQQDADRDQARYFSRDFSRGLPVRSLVFPDGKGEQGMLQGPGLIGRLKIGHLMDREIRALSTGEMRKVLIARALVGKPGLLILDEPFDGLDRGAREDLAAMVDVLIRAGLTVILATNRLEEIPQGVSHVLGLKEGRVMFSGSRASLLKAGFLDRLYGAPAAAAGRGRVSGSPRSAAREWGGRQPLVEMRKITVRHGPLTVVENLDWVIRRGENWALVGPNGSGKTTLVKMISGDHLQAYANEIYLFGRRRGSGESIWEIKEKIGLVSFELQVGYRAEIAALSVVVSGFYSSIGLYRIAEREQRRAALGWMALLGIEDLAPKPFAHLSQGQQRMVLLARAMVKRPLLLLLDEPCQGLDPSNRRMVFEVIEAIGRQAGTQILLVTHFESEMPDCIRHVLRLGGGLQTDQSVRKAR